jgi:CDP-diglyceride synthetase
VPDQNDDRLWKVTHVLHEPAAINAVQFLANMAAAASGLLAMLGGMPNLVTAQIGPVMSVAVGAILLVGGTLGALAVATGAWWLERISLLIVAVGWVSLLPAAISFAGRPQSTGTIWLVVALLVVAISDIFKRYRRIDWAYLDPTR